MKTTNLTPGIVIALRELSNAYEFNGCMQYNIDKERPMFSCGFNADKRELLNALISVCIAQDISFSVEYSGLGAVNFKCI